jgi:hypothetical protein
MRDRKAYLKYQKEYYLRNKKRKLKAQRAYRKANPEKYRSVDRGNAVKPERRFQRAQRVAAKHDKKWTLTLRQYKKLISKPCYYCNNAIASVQDNIGVGLDRLDNSKGYEPRNVIPSCHICNRTRNVFFSVEETKTMIACVLSMRSNP